MLAKQWWELQRNKYQPVDVPGHFPFSDTEMGLLAGVKNQRHPAVLMVFHLIFDLGSGSGN